ncbi:DsbA family oxidoreductase [Actinosynnema sp. NPDC050436]|uniref:DsbA family oxidoreductase n=1 Tax=Actinosynnema sp. NPDC050436 TaxID=3155659 RepID=UPI00340DF77D
MRVEIWSDLVCPWCYIGITRFEQALAGFEHADDVEVVHRSYELDPAREPGATESVTDMLTAKYGPRGATMDGEVAELARGEGLGYRTDREVGSTLDAHRLLHFAREQGVQHRLVKQLFAAHFAEGTSLFGTEALVTVAKEAGLDPVEARGVLEDPQSYLDAVRSDEAEAAQLGANGVPFFVIDRKFGVSGAQPVETFAEALGTAWTDARS